MEFNFFNGMRKNILNKWDRVKTGNHPPEKSRKEQLLLQGPSTNFGLLPQGPLNSIHFLITLFFKLLLFFVWVA